MLNAPIKISSSWFPVCHFSANMLQLKYCQQVNFLSWFWLAPNYNLGDVCSSKLTFGTRGCQTASWKNPPKKNTRLRTGAATLLHSLKWHPSYMTLDFKTRQENHSVGCIYFSFFPPSKLPVFREWHSGEAQNKTKENKRKSMGQEKSV